MIKALINLSYPMVISRLFGVLLEVISVFIVAHLGIDYLSAYGVAAPIYLTVNMLAMGYLLVFSVKAARFINQEKRLFNYIYSSVVFSLILAFFVILIFCILPSILPLLGQNPVVCQLSGDFLYYLSFGIPGVFISLIFSQTLIIYNKSFFVTLISFLQLIVGVIAIYLFTNFFHIGLKGVGLGFAFAFWLKACLSVIYFINIRKPNLRQCIATRTQFFEDLKFLTKIGWPVSLQYGGELMAGTIAVLMIGHLFSQALAAQQLANQLRVFFIMIPYGLSQAASILVAKINFTDLEIIKVQTNKIFCNVFKLTCIVMTPIIVLMLAISHWYIDIFLHTENLQLKHIADVFIFITALGLILDSAKYLIMGLLRGLRHTKGSMYVSLIFYYLVGVPMAYLLGYIFNIGPIGIRIGMVIGLGISTVILLFYYFNYVNFKIVEIPELT